VQHKGKEDILKQNEEHAGVVQVSWWRKAIEEEKKWQLLRSNRSFQCGNPK
jgi:hypothetical protein